MAIPRGEISKLQDDLEEIAKQTLHADHDFGRPGLDQREAPVDSEERVQLQEDPTRPGLRKDSSPGHPAIQSAGPEARLLEEAGLHIDRLNEVSIR